MTDYPYKEHYNVEDLRKIVKILRAPGGCPWDMEQTHESIRRDFIEEVYEVAEAIDEKSPEHLREELGDVLLQVVFHASIEEDADRFDLDDVADEVCKKMIFRHPHVFAGATADTSEEVLKNWDVLKQKEKGQATATETLNSVARSLPGLWRAEKLQKKAAKVGFDWPDIRGAMGKLEEELGELKTALSDGTNVEEELGDLLFATVNVARFAKIDPETALEGTCEKFIRRFSGMEQAARGQGKDLSDLSLTEQDALWDQEKAKEKTNL